MDPFYNVMAVMLMAVLVCSTITFGYFGYVSYRPRRYLASAFSWIACGLYVGVTALSGFVFFG